MRRNHFLLQIIFLVSSSCSFLKGESTDDATTGGTSDPFGKETATAKEFYIKQRAQFNFHVYAFIRDLNNCHEMYIRRILEKKGHLIRIAGDVVFIKN